MRLYPVEAGNFKLDGGAMFGVVPKTLWERTNPSDDKNRIEMASRCLLVEEGKRLILIDTGMGNKQGDSFFRHYGLWGDYSLVSSLALAGFHPDDITDVFFTHLHFDHCGGAVNKDNAGKLIPAFKNAYYWVHKSHWEWATFPNAREKASFLPDNILPLEQSGQLKFIEDPGPFIKETPFPFSIQLIDGHTEKQMLPLIEYQGEKILYAADLVPTVGHIPIPYIMGYDTRPLLTLKEKEQILRNSFEKEVLLFLQHDPHHQLISLQNTEKGIRMENHFKFKSYFSP
ncbi:MAG: putative quorum-quenching lactonase YtnP [uncultured Bacteroidota bacterium]|jgi:glyoxylase-like metal-dependent hydrolase (beta-lactamase superfamily II)|nr:MAG: putative quorum-quenching lactonase YtnP [uncultured Bacteroidetes bacterium]